MISYYYEDNKVYAYFDLYRYSKYINNHDRQVLEEARKMHSEPNGKPLANDLYRGWEYKLFNDVCNIMRHLFINDEDIDIIIAKILRNRHNFYGIAKCNPNDEYNKAIGEEIAKARLLEKYYRTKRRMLDEIFKELCRSAIQDGQHIIKAMIKADKEVYRESNKLYDTISRG